MAERTIDIKELAAMMRATGDIARKSFIEALFRTTVNATARAKENATKQFTGRRGYTLSGRLLNSIQYRFKRDGDSVSAYVGSYGIPYGAVHEYGDTIKPKNAKHLWMRLPATTLKASPFRRMTPSEFYKEAKNKGSGFYYMRSRRGNLFAMFRNPEAPESEPTPLFWLRSSVDIPERPYLRPAVAAETKKYPSLFQSIFVSYVARTR